MMIICILETYQDDGPIVWFANMDEARPEFIEGIAQADDNDSLPPTERRPFSYGDFGFQHDQDVKLAVTPPVHVDREIWIHFD
jgi:hypothetical protein